MAIAAAANSSGTQGASGARQVGARTPSASVPAPAPVPPRLGRLASVRLEGGGVATGAGSRRGGGRFSARDGGGGALGSSASGDGGGGSGAPSANEARLPTAAVVREGRKMVVWAADVRPSDAVV